VEEERVVVPAFSEGLEVLAGLGEALERLAIGEQPRTNLGRVVVVELNNDCTLQIN
jgi:hypothetical protein